MCPLTSDRRSERVSNENSEILVGNCNFSYPPLAFNVPVGGVMEVYYPSFTYILGTHAEQYAQ